MEGRFSGGDPVVQLNELVLTFVLRTSMEAALIAGVWGSGKLLHFQPLYRQVPVGLTAEPSRSDFFLPPFSCLAVEVLIHAINTGLYSVGHLEFKGSSKRLFSHLR